MSKWMQHLSAVRCKNAVLVGLLLALWLRSQVFVAGVASAARTGLQIAAAGTATITPTPFLASGRALCRPVRQSNGRMRVECSFPKPPGSILATRLAPKPAVQLTLMPVRTRAP